MTSLDDLAGLYERSGPFVTVYLDTTSSIENAGGLLALRWKSDRRRLARAGADEATLAAVDLEAEAGHTPGDTRAVIATDGSVLHVSNRPEPPIVEMARWASLPVLGPLIASRQASVPHVIVLADRTGGDIVAHPRLDLTFAVSVAGAEAHLTKSTPEGCSQPRLQQRAENTWQDNAVLVAATLSGVVDDVRPRVVIVGGDIRAVRLLKAALPKRVLDRLHIVDGCRSDGTNGRFADGVAGVLRNAVAEETESVLAEFREARGRGPGAADGPGATLKALAEGRVDTLLVHDAAGDRRHAWFGPGLAQVASTRRAVRSNGPVATDRRGRLVDIALRAAFGTGAQVRILPSLGMSGPKGGVGALLRY